MPIDRDCLFEHSQSLDNALFHYWMEHRKRAQVEVVVGRWPRSGAAHLGRLQGRLLAQGGRPPASRERPSFAGSAQFRNKLLHVRHSQAGNQVVAGARMVGAVAARHDVTETVRAEQRVEQRVKKRQ
jgi:hypothetical protein